MFSIFQTKNSRGSAESLDAYFRQICLGIPIKNRLTIVNEGSSSTLVNEGLSLTIVNETKNFIKTVVFEKNNRQLYWMSFYMKLNGGGGGTKTPW